MNITVEHRCGRTKIVYAFLRPDFTAAGRIVISWPLGDLFEVDLETGHLVPDEEQDPRVADWSVQPADLTKLRAVYQRAERAARAPIAKEPEELR
jgi:hypothetical protein